MLALTRQGGYGKPPAKNHPQATKISTYPVAHGQKAVADHSRRKAESPILGQTLLLTDIKIHTLPEFR